MAVFELRMPRRIHVGIQQFPIAAYLVDKNCCLLTSMLDQPVGCMNLSKYALPPYQLNEKAAVTLPYPGEDDVLGNLMSRYVETLSLSCMKNAGFPSFPKITRDSRVFAIFVMDGNNVTIPDGEELLRPRRFRR